MNPEIPEERKYIEELTQEYIYLCEQLDFKERYTAKGKDIFHREKEDKILRTSKNLYTGKRLLKKLETLYKAIQIEVERIAEKHFKKTNEILTIHNCYYSEYYYFYYLITRKLIRYINILKEDPPPEECERQYIQNEYRTEISFIARKQIPEARLFDLDHITILVAKNTTLIKYQQ
ncbi:hypothetical protein C2G38_2173484 [Gigaspora rosea]|uniref:Uncharacterized protein n=1 Tax=Gigaspora rosea TaxID=44941 RepID=A0A397VUD7_9GLOM|nr:hypothetical protein C2G38_2173484 [Gigaspora rosea]